MAGLADFFRAVSAATPSADAVKAYEGQFARPVGAVAPPVGGGGAVVGGGQIHPDVQRKMEEYARMWGGDPSMYFDNTLKKINESLLNPVPAQVPGWTPPVGSQPLQPAVPGQGGGQFGGLARQFTPEMLEMLRAGGGSPQNVLGGQVGQASPDQWRSYMDMGRRMQEMLKPRVDPNSGWLLGGGQQNRYGGGFGYGGLGGYRPQAMGMQQQMGGGWRPGMNPFTPLQGRYQRGW